MSWEKARANRWKKWTDDDYRAKLKSLVVVTESGCWEKQGFRYDLGYGSMCIRNRQYRSHVAAYLLWKGEVPKGMCVMHTCDNPPCCNPDHLKLGTKGDNNRDMFAKRRNVYNPARYTSCKNGHEFTPENTAVTKLGHRKCKRCQLIKYRIASGWTREQAETLPITPKGRRPVGGTYKKPVEPPRVRTFSTRGSSPRQRAWRARQKAKRLALATQP